MIGRSSRQWRRPSRCTCCGGLQNAFLAKSQANHRLRLLAMVTFAPPRLLLNRPPPNAAISSPSGSIAAWRRWCYQRHAIIQGRDPSGPRRSRRRCTRLPLHWCRARQPNSSGKSCGCCLRAIAMPQRPRPRPHLRRSHPDGADPRRHRRTTIGIRYVNGCAPKCSGAAGASRIWPRR